jgi:deazaflavin-dependent oxidoreductase (nitroreductase family)
MPMNPVLMKAIGRIHRALYRLTAGAIGGSLAGRPMLLLTTTGRKTGKSRTTPLQYSEDGENMVVVASNGGNPRHPAWWFNLEGNPEAEVQVRKIKKRVKAETANEEERSRLWPLLVETYPGYEEYQKSTERTIPVVILRPEG